MVHRHTKQNPNAIPTWVPLDVYYMASKNALVFIGHNPFEDRHSPNDTVIGFKLWHDGELKRVKAVERQAVFRPLKQGDPIGFILEGRVS